ncbi:tRNA 5-methoxyuridine(34)/uridine 5-oxyacetic acid(34) synthase CmoB [Desulfospira joergensenii]|uniref:tRNA 5-methoxyuridine(34)/uridine 5-oxyacetic acid(34) synthase CmoB n=1 Tax=Desulfospira joergensenii TaxID=53329 RepID=UPI0003B39189|nr:tRNA 5-methoxyuridine(34)/uridine 5-oxyacetic acid(34) synthase CmoB [Desulfospira joergensenii]
MERFLEKHMDFGFGQYSDELHELVRERRTFLDQAGGNFEKYRKVVDSIPEIRPSKIELDGRFVTAGSPSDISPEQGESLKEKLARLCPWRKGPFDFFGVKVDAEWQSWMKWNRILPHLPELKYKRILDIGSSNGYYMFRMAGMGPQMVLGVEPQSAFYYQYLAARKFLNLDNVFCLPVPYDSLPPMEKVFDLVFCMGILYHRKSPIEMLKQIHDSLKLKGQLILENLVLEGRNNLCLFPRDRYAKMRNVFFIPDLAAMESWLERAGFRDIKCLDVTRTNPLEQRKTDWIQTESLEDFLDPEDPLQTVEGYPGPVRAVFSAVKE